MKFTKYHSLHNILEYPEMEQYLKIFYSDFLLEMFPQDMADEPLALTEHFGKTPWDEPFSVIVDQLIDAANLILDIRENGTRECIPLWFPQEKSWTLEEEKKGGKHQTFLLSPAGQEKGALRGKQGNKLKKAAILCPGGGYEAVCFCGEGTPVLRLLEARGYVGFILKYQVAPQRYPQPQKDLALAIQYVRYHCGEYGVDPNEILVVGASAGGHLCALEAAMYKEMESMVYTDLAACDPQLAREFKGVSAKPDKICLSYPVISFTDEPHEGSFQNLTGGAKSLREALSVEKLVTKDYPRTYVWTCRDDDCVPPSNALRMAQALERKQVAHKLSVFPQGGHGCGLAFTKSAYLWSREMLDFMK